MKQAETIYFSYEQLERWCNTALTACGMSQKEAEVVTQVLLESNLRGTDTHGINMVPLYARRYQAIEHRPIRVETDKGAGCIVDGGNHTGQMTSVFALDRAIEKADQFGLGLALVKESCHNGAEGYYASVAAQRGYICMVATTVMPLLAPWGGLEPFIGNNPYAISFPYRQMPIVLDVANTVTARNKIITYAREGWTLPDGWAMDSEGNPTNDPNEAINGLLMPVGGHKGAGLALMIDIILGTLSGGTYSRAICANTVSEQPQHIAHLFLVINPDFYMAREALDQHISQDVTDFKQVRKKRDVHELLPGELEFNTRQTRLTQGIPISAAIVRELNVYAEAMGIPALIQE